MSDIDNDPPMLSDIGIKDGGLEFTVTGAKAALGHMASALAACFDADGGTNYVQYEVRSGERDFFLTLQKADKKSPHQLRKEAEAQRDELLAALKRLTAASGQVDADTVDDEFIYALMDAKTALAKAMKP